MGPLDWTFGDKDGLHYDEESRKVKSSLKNSFWYVYEIFNFLCDTPFSSKIESLYVRGFVYVK